MRNDFRFALRTLQRSPGFALVAILSLALGIGANTAIFSLLYQVALRSIPVTDPSALVSLQSDDKNFGWTRRDNNQTVFSYPMYLALRDHNQAFTGLIARSSFPATLAYRGDAIKAGAEVVTGNFFEVLGLKPALGRLLIPADDDAANRSPTIVLSYSYWSSRLGADPKVVNAPLLMNNHPVLVAGVAPRGFRGLLTGRDADFYAPISMMSMIATGWQRNEQPDAYWLNLLGRLRRDVNSQCASATLLPLFRSAFEDQLPRMKDVTEDARKKILAKPISVQPAVHGLNILRDQWQTPLLVLMVMVGLVLLIACANVANLMIARATARRREIAVRLALGATGWQLSRQMMVESLVLAIAGGLLGLLLSANLTAGLLRLLPADSTGGWLAPQLDLLVLALSTLISVLTGLLFAVAPILQAGKTAVAPALKEQSGGMSASGSQARSRQALVVAQICLSLLLLIGAGLFTRSLVNLIHSDPGFRADRLIVFSVDPSLSGYHASQEIALFRELQDRLSHIPGVQSAARAQLVPFGGWGWGNGVKLPGSRNASEQYAYCGENSVGPGYFATLGIPLLAGRDFSLQDGAASAKVAILSQSFARTLFENANPIGRHVRIGSNDEDAEIVGVVKDSRFNDVREKPPQFLYVPYEQSGDEFTRQSAFFVRVAGSQQSVMTAIRQIVRQSAPNVPVDRLTSMNAIIDDTIYTERLIATLAIAFGALATILAAVGLYGIVSYSVTRRTREFGIRLALGAVPTSLLAFVIREVGWLAAIGVAVGLPASYALARLAESQFYGVHAYDPWVLAGATILVAMMAFLAGLAPAVRAMRIEPVRALRYE